LDTDQAFHDQPASSLHTACYDALHRFTHLRDVGRGTCAL
jgi:hypothetical protein